MKILYTFAFLSAGLLLAACDSKVAEKPVSVAPPAVSSPTPTPPEIVAQTSVPSVSEPITTRDDTTRYVDHSVDEIEFKLRKSLAGLESMLETVSDADQLAVMKQDMADLQSRLDAL